MNVAAQLFEVARRSPDRPAVTSDGGTIHYLELVARIARLAGSLRDEVRLAPGARVVIWMENCPEFFEVLFACWTAGLCAIPINAKLHPKEVAYLADLSGAALLVSTGGLVDAVSALQRDVPALRCVCVGTREYRRLVGDGTPLQPLPAEPTDPAWIFFTSGTTGRPKGAVLTHRNLLFMSHVYCADIDFIDETDTKLHAAPLSHGSGLYGLPHLFKGSHQVVPGGSFDPARIVDEIGRHRNVTLFAAPTMLTRLVHSEVVQRADLRNLKTIYYGGGPMYVAALKRALAIFGPRLYQLFGQGESPMTITGLSKRLHGLVDHPRYDALLASCGYARTGVQVKVADADDRELPFGEIGEVLTRSDCVMQGYYGDAKASAETLRGGWLHTGDLGSMDPDGLLTLRDRSKDMIISGGSNIYPREIEEVLVRHADIVEASVVGRPHPEWGEEVVAFVVARPGATVAPAALDRLCLENIARYKRPREYRFIDALPKNNYGKVLKTELRRRFEQGET